MPNHVAMVPFMKPHGGIVIGKQASNIARLQKQFGCKIETHTAQPTADRPFPYFLVRGATERQVNHACLEIYKLLNTSMMNSDKDLRSQLEALEENQMFHEVEMDEKTRQIEELKQESDFQEYENDNPVNYVSAKDERIKELETQLAQLQDAVVPQLTGGGAPFNFAQDNLTDDEDSEDDHEDIM